jgi:putative redox protein
MARSGKGEMNMTIQAKLEWKEKMQFVGQAGDSPSVFIDTNDGKTGPTPMEMVLMGVAGCTAIDVIHIMNRRRAEVTGFQVNVTGERAEDHPKRYTRILIEYVLEGKGITSKDVERAIELSTTKYCSATASMNAQVETSYRIAIKDG